MVQPLQPAAVVRPVKNRLPLPSAALEVALLAVPADRGDVPLHCAPSPDLPCIIATAAAHVVPAVPLKPPARILRTDPSVPPPLRERQRGPDTEEIEPGIVRARAELRVPEPALRKLGARIGHVLPAEHPERQHLSGGQLRPERRVEIAARRLGEVVHVAPLHLVVDDDPFFHVLMRYQGARGAGCRAVRMKRAYNWPERTPRRGVRPELPGSAAEPCCSRLTFAGRSRRAALSDPGRP